MAYGPIFLIKENKIQKKRRTNIIEINYYYFRKELVVAMTIE